MEKKPRMELRRASELRQKDMILDRENVIISIECASRECRNTISFKGVLNKDFESELRKNGYETYVVRREGFLITIISW